MTGINSDFGQKRVPKKKKRSFGKKKIITSFTFSKE